MNILDSKIYLCKIYNLENPPFFVSVVFFLVFCFSRYKCTQKPFYKEQPFKISYCFFTVESAIRMSCRVYPILSVICWLVWNKVLRICSLLEGSEYRIELTLSLFLVSSQVVYSFKFIDSKDYYKLIL